MEPIDEVASALRRLTDGSLTFEIAEDRYSVVAAYRIDGRLVTYAWPKWEIDVDPEMVACGVCALLAKGNLAHA